MSILRILQADDPSFRKCAVNNVRESDLTVFALLGKQHENAIEATRAELMRMAKRTTLLTIAGDRSVVCDLRADATQYRAELEQRLFMRSSRVVNVTGTKLMHCKAQGVDQLALAKWFWVLFKDMGKKEMISEVRTSGQPGVEVAALIAAVALGINAQASMPSGYLVVDQQGNERGLEYEFIRQRIVEYARSINPKVIDHGVNITCA